MSEYPTIFDDGQGVRVLHDPDRNTIYPIALCGSDDGPEGWILRDEAVDAANAILAALGENSPADDEIVRASTISFNEGVLRVASVHDKQVTFRYAKGGGSVIETRVLKPAEVKTVKDHKVVVGFDPDRDEVRSYRLDRIKGDVAVTA